MKKFKTFLALTSVAFLAGCVAPTSDDSMMEEDGDAMMEDDAMEGDAMEQ